MRAFTFLSLLVMFALSHGELSFSPFFTDHMVIQREAPIRIKGTARPETGIQAELISLDRSLKGQTRADEEGTFTLELDPLPAGGPYRLTVSSPGESVTINDILLGDLWVCSGQSNMQWPLRETDQGEETISRSHISGIRLFTVPRDTANMPQSTVLGGPWQVASPETTADFSAVGIHFGRELHHRTGVPIGLINSSWGGTTIEVWISPEAINYEDTVPTMPARLELESREARQIEERVDSLLAAIQEKDTERKWSLVVRGSGTPRAATVCYNAMVHPLTGFPIKGVIWYQGESNASQAEEYRTLFPLFIKDWRSAWGQPELPVYFVQLANYMERADKPQESDWAELREAQTMALSLPGTGMAVAIDIGDAHDIHPRNKRDVGLRLARHALANEYGLGDVVTSGPVLKEARRKGSEMVLTFDQIHGGLELRPPLAGAFALADEEGPFHFAHPRIDGDTLVLSSPEVSHPAHVRYGWANNPPAPLYNGAGLPASPFRTDDRSLSAPGVGGSQNKPLHYLEAPSRQAFLDAPVWTTHGDLRYAATGETHDAPVKAAFDGDPETRWSVEELGSMLLVDLGTLRPCPEVLLSFYMGNVRRAIVRIETSTNGKTWEEAFFGLSSGTTEGSETFPGSEKPVRFVLLSFYGNTNSLWNSLIEVQFPKP